MSSLVVKNFNSYNAQAFARSFVAESIYLYVGRSTGWDIVDVETPEDHEAYHNVIKQNVLGMVRVLPSDVATAIDRNDWTSGNRYERYQHANASVGETNPYYVLAGYNDRSVYKCIDNNGNSISTSKPYHTNAQPTREHDGYVWKYMYTIPDLTFKKFATQNVIPTFVFGRPADDKNSILHIPISANNTTGIGSYYRGLGFVNTTFAATAVNATIYTTTTANTPTNQIRVVADSGLAPMNNYYNNSAFYVTSGIAAGTIRRVVSSVAETGDTVSNLVLSSAISGVANGDTFAIGPYVSANTLELGGGSGFYGYAKTNRYGNVTSISVLSGGKAYSNGYCNVNINGAYSPTTASLNDGTGAHAEMVISPSGGSHGYNPQFELNARYVVVSPQTTLAKDHENGTFIGYGNDYRQVGLIRNPIDASTGVGAVGASYDLRTTVYFASPTYFDFAEDEILYDSETPGQETASALVYSVCGDSSDRYLTLTDVVGNFANGVTLYNRNGVSATISSANLQYHRIPNNSDYIPKSPVLSGGITKYTGDILYHENIAPIKRRLDQQEEFKFVFEF